MKILLSGEPNTGKSTVLETFVSSYKGPLCGVVTVRIRDENGLNQGFAAKSVHTHEQKIIAHKHAINAPIIVGNSNHVDLNIIDSFVSSEIEKGLSVKDSVIIIDEIGEMQSYSKHFIKTAKNIIESKSHLLGTVVYKDLAFAREFKQNANIIILTVSKDNRDILPSVLLLIYNDLSLLEKLSDKQSMLLNEMLREYFRNDNYTQIKKIFNSALQYLLSKKINKEGLHYTVLGKHKLHKVEINPDKCDCDLFNGVNIYKNTPGECSHLQAVKLFLAK